MATYKCSIFLSQTTNEKAIFLLMIIKKLNLMGV